MHAEGLGPWKGSSPELGEMRDEMRPPAPVALQNSTLPRILGCPLIHLSTTLDVITPDSSLPKPLSWVGLAEDGNLDPHKPLEKANVPGNKQPPSGIPTVGPKLPSAVSPLRSTGRILRYLPSHPHRELSHSSLGPQGPASPEPRSRGPGDRPRAGR